MLIEQMHLLLKAKTINAYTRFPKFDVSLQLIRIDQNIGNCPRFRCSNKGLVSIMKEPIKLNSHVPHSQMFYAQTGYKDCTILFWQRKFSEIQVREAVATLILLHGETPMVLQSWQPHKT